MTQTNARSRMVATSRVLVLLTMLAIPSARMEAETAAQQGARLAGNDIALKMGPVCSLILVLVLIGLVAFYRYRALRTSSRIAEREASQRIRETDDVTDQLLQGVQGLLLTFHVAAQNISEEHASKKLLNHALSEADELVSTGRRRFERAAFQPAVEDRSAAANSDRTMILDALKNNYLDGVDYRGDNDE